MGYSQIFILREEKSARSLDGLEESCFGPALAPKSRDNKFRINRFPLGNAFDIRVDYA